MATDHRLMERQAKRATIAWMVFAILAAFYLWTEHRAHLLGILPFVLLLSCPLMHLFMHHGHRHEHSNLPPTDRTDGKGESK